MTHRRMDRVTSNHLLRGGLGLSLLLFIFLLISCQTTISETGDGTEESLGVIASQRAATAVPASVPAIRLTIMTLDHPATVPMNGPAATEISSGEVEIISESETKANADVEFVRAVQSADGSWTFYVTVSHPDTGWEDYADGWDVVTVDGSIVQRSAGDPFTRLLLHPHETEQPFTRSQSSLVIPEGISQVTVRAHDLVNGFGGRQIDIDLNENAGPDFEVER
jgi:hypothetical protein